MGTKYTGKKYGTEIFGTPTKLQKAIDEYISYIDSLPHEHVRVGKNIYEREVPYTVEGLCAFLGVQKADVKQLLTDPSANVKARTILTDKNT